MPSYDASHFDPPAPVAQVTLRNSQTGALLPDIILLLDTGADTTLLPRASVERLNIQPIEGADYELISFDGSRSTAQAVDLDVVFLNRIYRGRYLLIEDERGVLGRDVLGEVSLILDGPRREWSEHKA